VARVVGLAVVGALVASSAGVLLSGGLGDDAEEPTTTTVDVEGLSDEAQELVALLQRARAVTYHVRYEGRSPELPDATIRVETWQQPPRIRQDSELPVQGQLARTRTLVLPDGGARCTQIGEQPWQCRRSTAAESETDVVSGDVVEQLRTAEVRARHTTIDGREVRCFTLSLATGATSELCANADGVPVLVRAGDSELRLLLLDQDVPAGTFDPPAPVT
jgi:hypothetical protein